MMTKEEFMSRPSDFSFCLNPLDVNLVKMQESLIKQMESEGPKEDGSFESKAEHYESKNPEREYRDILLLILETEPTELTKTRMFQVKLLVFDKSGNNHVEEDIFHSTWERTCMFIRGEAKASCAGGKWPLLNICKAHALWLDYCVKNMTFQDHVRKLVLRVIEQTEKHVPEYGDFMPVRELMDNPDRKYTNHLVGKYGLQIFKMPKDIEPDPTKRYIKASAFDPTGKWESKMVVGSGTKEEILAIMRDEGFVEKLSYTYGDLTDNLRDM